MIEKELHAAYLQMAPGCHSSYEQAIIIAEATENFRRASGAEANYGNHGQEGQEGYGGTRRSASAERTSQVYQARLMDAILPAIGSLASHRRKSVSSRTQSNNRGILAGASPHAAPSANGWSTEADLDADLDFGRFDHEGRFDAWGMDPTEIVRRASAAAPPAYETHGSAVRRRSRTATVVVPSAKKGKQTGFGGIFGTHMDVLNDDDLAAFLRPADEEDADLDGPTEISDDAPNHSPAIYRTPGQGKHPSDSLSRTS